MIAFGVAWAARFELGRPTGAARRVAGGESAPCPAACLGVAIARGSRRRDEQFEGAHDRVMRCAGG